MSKAAIRVSKGLKEIARELGDHIEEIAGEPVSFSLFVWTEDRCNYISNSKNRTEIKTALKSVINGWDNGMPDIPAHEVI